jgi:tRNA(Arg) A34 adenosine deaminase TadA
MARPQPIDLRSMPMATHERFMRLAVEQARGNPAFPFGAVIVQLPEQQVMAAAVNRGFENPILHGEIAAINNYVARNGNRGWQETVLYTTGEPCPMCMSAIIWSGIGGVVYATSIAGLKQVGFDQIDIGSSAVAASAAFWHGGILGGVLAEETDRMFAERPRG